MQAVNIDGSSITASNVLDNVFDGYTERMVRGKGGKAPEVLMSFKNFGSVLKEIETSKGSFNVVPMSRKTNQYGWATIEVGSVSGDTLTIVGIQEMPDSEIMYLDWDSVTFYTNGLFRRRRAPDGKEFYETRATSGYAYILDHCVFGDLVCTAPWKNAVIHSISY